MTTQPPNWPRDAAGRPAPEVVGRPGVPDLQAINWPLVNGAWAPVGPDGTPLVPAAAVPPTRSRRRLGHRAVVALVGVVALLVGVGIGAAGGKGSSSGVSKQQLADAQASIPALQKQVASAEAALSGADARARAAASRDVASAKAAANQAQSDALAASASVAAANAGQGSDQGFTLVEFSEQNDSLGQVGCRARIRNDNTDTESANFTVTLMQNGSTAASCEGSVQSEAPGQVKTVDLISQDPAISGRFTYTFQVDITVPG